VTEIRALAEAVADALADRGLVVQPTAGMRSRVLTVSDVAQMLGRKPAWVYEHAAELGAFRFGDGPRARIGFDLPAIEDWKRERQIGRSSSSATPRLRGPADRPGTNLIPYQRSGRGA
jgi:hypothetical protein